MARRRKDKADSWLPPRVYRGRSAYEWRPKDGPYVKLCPLKRDGEQIVEPPEIKRKVLEAYETAAKVATQRDVDYWLTRFFLSRRFLQLGRHTQGDYQRYAEVKVDPEKPGSRNGVRTVFGRMLPAAVKPHHIRRYMDYWADAGKEITANRHLSFLQTFFGWLREQNAGVLINPAHGISKFPERTRRYYITDDEYTRLMVAATASTTPYVAAFIEITYLCGLRRHEALRINIEDITDAGLNIRRGKGSKDEITEISPRLQAAIDFARSLHKPPEPIANRPLIRNTRGQRVTSSAINQAFAAVREAAGLTHIRIHDLKKKAGTDGKDLGHKTQAMRDLYDLKLAVKAPTK